MYQLVRDTDRAGSIARGHSLLQDKYGHFSVRARIQQAVVDSTTNQYPAGGQILELRIVIDPQVLPTPLTVTSTPGNRGLSMLSLGALNGRVVTFLDGVGQNVSGRIIKSSPNIVASGATASYNYTIRLLSLRRLPIQLCRLISLGRFWLSTEETFLEQARDSI